MPATYRTHNLSLSQPEPFEIIWGLAQTGCGSYDRLSGIDACASWPLSMDCHACVQDTTSRKKAVEELGDIFDWAFFWDRCVVGSCCMMVDLGLHAW